jgi:drug/metabolite transporter (DMT)-like permease
LSRPATRGRAVEIRIRPSCPIPFVSARFPSPAAFRNIPERMNRSISGKSTALENGPLENKAGPDSKRLGTSDLLMVLAVSIWALNFSALKISLPYFSSPHVFNFLRLLGSTLILFIALRLSEGSLAVSRSDFLRLAAVGVMGNFLYQVLFIQGLELTSASNTSFILATTPIMVALVSMFLKHDRLHWASWLGIAVSFGGLYLIITRQSGAFELKGLSIKGDLMVLVGNIFWTLYTVFSKPLLDRMSPLRLTAWTMAAGTLAYLPVAMPPLLRQDWRRPMPVAWAGLGYSAIFAIVLGFVFWYTSVQRVGNSRTAVYGNITPVLTAVSAHFILGEKLSKFQALGAAIILAGVYLTRSGYRFFLRTKIPSSDGA